MLDELGVIDYIPWIPQREILGDLNEGLEVTDKVLALFEKVLGVLAKFLNILDKNDQYICSLMRY